MRGQMVTLRGLVVSVHLGAGTFPSPRLVIRDEVSGADVSCNIPEEFIVEMDELPIHRPVEVKMINGTVQSLQLLEE